MKEYSRTPPLKEGHGGRRSSRRTSRNANLGITVTTGDPPPPTPLNLAIRNDLFSHIRVIPKPSVEVTPEQMMPRTNPFTFKKASFSEEAEASLSSQSGPYNWQANLANASDGSSFAQKARAAELNAARARKAAQMQSIDDEIPDLSGPVSLGMYTFTRRGRGKKYETHRLSELPNAREKEIGNRVMIAAPTPSAHQPSNPSSPTTFPSFQLSKRSSRQTKTDLNDTILDRLGISAPDLRDSHEPGLCQRAELGPTHSAADFPGLNSSIYSSKPSHQESGQVKSSFSPAQDHRSTQDTVSPDVFNQEASEQVYSSVLPDYHRSKLQLTATISPVRQSVQPGLAQTDKAFPLEHPSSNENINALIDTDRHSSQAPRQSYQLFPPSDRNLDTPQKYSQLAQSLNALIQFSGGDLKASRKRISVPQPRDLKRLTADPYPTGENKVDELLETHRQTSGASSQTHPSVKPKGYASPESLPLSDILPTASFNLETNQWDPDLPEANMSAQTPTNKSTRGGHSGQQSSGKSSSQTSLQSQEMRNPYAIVTTTKSGRPYTNPYMPIYSGPSAAGQTVRRTPSGNFIRGSQSEDAEIIERQRQTRYIDQEEARYRALEQANHGHAKEPLDDPFQDQTAQIQERGRNQSSNYAEYAVNQATYGQLPGYHYQPTPTNYLSDPNAPHLVSDLQVKHADPTQSPYRGQRSAYEQQPVINTRASVRLPAVKGTAEQQKLFQQEPNLGSLSLQDSSYMNAQDPRRLQTQSGIQQASGRVSHAVPIRDPAAYTGSGLTSRRNQEALRQNLDTVVASSQGSTGVARTVMNDPHRDRQLPSRPSPTATDTTVTGSTLRAQAPSYESVKIQRPETMHSSVLQAGTSTSQRQGKAILGGKESLPLHTHTSHPSKGFEQAAADPEVMHHREGHASPAVPPGFGLEAAAYSKSAGLPNKSIGAGNAFMQDLMAQVPPKRTPQEQLEDSMAWFRYDPRDLSYAAAILPYETMNKMNAQQFPLEDRAHHTVGQLADDSQDDDPTDRSRQAATPRPIGHGRPAGFATPPSIHGTGRAANQAPFSTLSSVASTSDKEGMERSGREFLRNDAQAIEAMFGGVYSNLMSGKNGPYDYMNHYCAPPAYAIDHNARNNSTLFDPQWFATAPPARVGRDPRREQGEYEDPTLGVSGRRGDHGRAENIRRDSGGLGGGGGVRAWGRN